MLAKLAGLKVNFLVTFAGAAIVILLIKTTPLLLPAKFYFDFSSLVVGSSGPFIVDPPSVSGARLCEVMRQYGITQSAFRRQVICNLDHEGGLPLSREQADEIYSAVLRSDPAIRAAYQEAARTFGFRRFSDSEVRKTVSEAENALAGYEALSNAYAERLSRLSLQGPSELLQKLFENFNQGRDPDNYPSSDTKVSQEDINRLVAANRTLPEDLGPSTFVMAIKPIGKSDVDELIEQMRSRGDFTELVATYYHRPMTDALRTRLDNAFTAAGVTTSATVMQRTVLNEINSFSWKNYAASVLFRLTPVFLFGLIAGAALGRSELFSISLAGGLAAFLLSWPLILMWDRLVQSEWQQRRLLFLGFYLAYMLSCFLAARAGAVLGIWIREQRVLRMPDVATHPGGAAAFRLGWSNVIINLLAALAINALVYAWNVYLPLAGATTVSAAR